MQTQKHAGNICIYVSEWKRMLLFSTLVLSEGACKTRLGVAGKKGAVETGRCGGGLQGAVAFA